MLNQLGIISGKLAGATSRLLGKNGGTVPGQVGLLFDENMLAKLAKQVDHIVLITGTNGKTTVSNLVGAIMKEIDPGYVNNVDGSNLRPGITASFIKRSTLLGKVKATYAILEVDEASLTAVLKQVTPDLICITNFFRDQLDRYGEIDTLIGKLEAAIKPINTKLLLNSDDPFSYRFSQLGKETYFFGCQENAYDFEKSTMSDSKFCMCQKEFTYDFIHYGQLGAYVCECGVKRPEPNFAIETITTDDETSILVDGVEYTASLKGAYNGYNMIAAISICQLLKIPIDVIQKGMNAFETLNGRMQTLAINNIPYTINLVKNPQGMNSTLATIIGEESEKQLVLLLNDGEADGRDVSWIWDADFEKLQDQKVVKIIAAGSRAYDMAIRLQHAGIPAEAIEVIQEPAAAVLKSAELKVPTFIIPNYTPLATVLKTIESMKAGE